MYKPRILFSKHALARMSERRISIEHVVEAINDPQQILYDSWRDLYLYVSRYGDAIVCAFRGSVIEVVTVLGPREYNALVKKYGEKRYKVIE